MARNLVKLGALEAQKTAFLLCDIQETFRPHVKHFGEVVKVANKMVEAAKHFKIPVYVSEQYPKGLGRTTKDINICDAALVYEKTRFSMYTPELQERLKKDVPGLDAIVLFGIEDAAGTASLVQCLWYVIGGKHGWLSNNTEETCCLHDGQSGSTNGLLSVVLDKFDCPVAHVCIEQTVIDLLNENIVVHVLADGVSSRSLMDRGLALQRMQSLGAFISTAENVLFKLMKDKNHPVFRDISKLNKEPTVDTLGYTRFHNIGCFVGTSENVLFKLLKDKNNPAFKEIAKLNMTPTPDEFGAQTLEKKIH